MFILEYVDGYYFPLKNQTEKAVDFFKFNPENLKILW